MKKNKTYDFFKSQKINYADLSNDIKCEVAILGGLDIFTDAHVNGVTDITTKICQELKMDYPRLKHIVVGAYLHDVGKIMIPKEVLQKNGRLTDEEYAIIQSHTTHGYDICMKHKELRKYAPIARWHHESFNGTGYPDKLVGNQIPFEASVVKVADVYDALTRRRQYKEGFKQSDTIRMMIEDAKAGKMSAKILIHLIDFIMKELEEKIVSTMHTIAAYRENVETLHEVEKIYKEIYDSGYSTKLEKKLKKYELAPGYDMGANANLLTAKQKALEKETEQLNFCKEEKNLLQSMYKEVYTLAQKENWYQNEEYYQ